MPSSTTLNRTNTLAAQNLSNLQLQAFDTEFTAGPWKLTLSQLVRGADAAAQIAAASDQNAAPPDGIDYLLFYVKATNSGQLTTWIDYDDFAVFGGSGIVRRSLELMPPDPMLQSSVEAGASTEGWVVGAIETGEGAPVILFDSRILTGDWADQLVATVAGGTMPSTGASPATVNNAGTDPASPVAATEQIVTADWSLQLMQTVFAQDVYDLTDFRTQAVGDSEPDLIQNWVAMQLEVTNNRTGTSVAHFPATAFALAWSDGSQVYDVSRLTPPIPDISGDYLPGATRQGWAAFERPPGFEGSLVRFQPYATDQGVRYLTWGDGSAPSGPDDVVVDEATPAAPTQAFENGANVVINESDVNLRAQPSTTAEIVETLTQGTALTITGDSVEEDGYTWYPVEDPANGNTGFVVANFLRSGT